MWCAAYGLEMDSAELRAEAVLTVADAAALRGWGAVAATTSPLPGPSGNVEFFLWLRRGPASVTADQVDALVRGDDPLAAAARSQDPGEKVES